MSRLIDDARLVGLKRMTLEVQTDNIFAIKMYESFGFVTEGIRKNYYEGIHDAYIMWKDL